MAYVNMQVDPYELLCELSDSDLRKELINRARKPSAYWGIDDYQISPVAAREALAEASDRLRKLDHYALAFKLDEIREDYCS